MHRPQLLFTLGCVVLMTASLRAGQLNHATEPCQAGQAFRPQTNKVPADFNNSTDSLASAVETVAPGIVRIVTVPGSDRSADLAAAVTDPSKRFLLGQALDERSLRQQRAGLGAGVIVSEDGYILTCCHLVTGASEVDLTLQDGREFKAAIIGADVVTDVAVIKIDAQNLPKVSLAESRNVRVGDVVLAIGYPFGLGQTVTHGIVSAIARGTVAEDYESFIQTDAPINPGNSGGALVDVHGGLIGINTAILSGSGGNMGIGFAIPSDQASSVLADLVEYGFVRRGYFGIEAQNLTPELAKEFNLGGTAGALVCEVVTDGPAEKAGLQVGDVITRFNGKQVRDGRELRLSVAEAKANQTVPVDVLRNGSAKSLQVILGQAPTKELAVSADWAPEEQHPGTLQGVILVELSGQVRQYLKIPHEVQGAVVLDMHAYSAAAQAGIRPGDVIESINLQEIRNVEDVSRLTQSPGHKHALVRVWSQGGNHFVLVKDSER